MKKRTSIMKHLWIIVLVMAVLCAVLTMGCAENATETTEVTGTYVSGESSLSNEAAAKGYVNKAFFGEEPNQGSVAGSQLQGKNAWLYDALKQEVTKVADGQESSAVFTFPLEQVFDDVEYGAEALDLADLSYNDAVGQAFIRKLLTLVSPALDALQHDCPYELYWFDKTVGIQVETSFYIADDQTVRLANYENGSVTFKFSVADAYAGIETFSVDPSTGLTVQSAVRTAQEIVNRYTSRLDYYKLKAYKDEICRLTEYNTETAGNDNTLYGALWQLVYVFDGDPATKVVSEGYTKAFQYLFDKSSFSNASCITVSGTMTGGTGAGNHMWNIVTLDGDNYIADITNSDEGTVGERGRLFLNGFTNVNASGMYTFRDGTNVVTYAYSSDTIASFGSTGRLTLYDADYTPPECDHENWESQEKWSDETSIIVLDDRYHYIEGTRIVTQYCCACGKVMGTTETEHNEQAYHSWVRSLIGEEPETCDVCGRVNSCIHNNHETAIEWRTGPDYTSLGSEGHQINSSVIIREICNDCFIYLSETENETYEAVSNHGFDENGRCSQCLYQCPHEHTHVETPFYVDHFESIDNFSHTASGHGETYDYCEDCYARLNYVENTPLTKELSHNYSFDGELNEYRCQECGHVCTHVFDNGVCTACGYNCPHEYGEEVTWTEEGLFLENWDETQHAVYDSWLCYGQICGICGDKLIDQVTYPEPIRYDDHVYEDGCCACGADCPHVGLDEQETATRVTKDPEWVRKDPGHHVLATLTETYAKCPVCGQDVVISWEIAEEIPGTEEACEFDDDSYCPICGTNCPHVYNGSSICTLCGHLCSHEFDGNGHCTVCNYQCTHEVEGATVNDDEWPEYDWKSTEQHIVRTWVKTHIECPDCYYIGQAINRVDNEQAEDHTDTDEDGICDICHYGIQEYIDCEYIDGILMIIGRGSIPDFTSGDETPWAEYRDSTKKIIIDKNIVGIGDYAFSGFTISGLRVEFNQNREPEISQYAFSGTSDVVCRYFTDTAWPGGNYGGENISWIYLPTNELDGNVGSTGKRILSFEYTNEDWFIHVENEDGTNNIPMTAAQVSEAAYDRHKGLTFEMIPTTEEDQSVYSDWDQVSHITINDGCNGRLDVRLTEDSVLQYVKVQDDGSTISITDPRENGLYNLMVNQGTVEYQGNVQNLLLQGIDRDTTPSVSISGNVDSLFVNGDTMDRPYGGSLIISNGLIRKGFVNGKGTLDIPGVGIKAIDEMVTASFENATGEVIQSGALHVEGLTPVALSLDMYTFDYTFLFFEDKLEASLLLHMKQDAFERIAGDNSIDNFSIFCDHLGIQIDQIIWGKDTTVSFETGGMDEYFELNGTTDAEGRPVGLAGVTIRSGKVKINCPTGEIIIANRRYEQEGIGLIINSDIDFLWLAEIKPDSNISIEAGGSVQNGKWSRRNLAHRLFGPVNAAGTIYSDGSLHVMSWKEGQELKAKLPPNERVALAAGLSGNQSAYVEVDQLSEEDLAGGAEGAVLAAFIESQGGNDRVVAVFDASVTSYTEDEDGNITPGGAITQLKDNVSITVNNNTGESCYVVRLHKEGEDTEVTVTRVSGEATTESDVPFESNLFSTYALLSTGPAEEGEWTGEVSETGVLTISGTGATASYALITDLPWFSDLDRINLVVVQEGITYLGDNVLAGLNSEIRVDLCQNEKPGISAEATGGASVVYRYYSTDASWDGFSGIYLPVRIADNSIDGNIRRFEYRSDGWYASVYDAVQGRIPVRMTVDQVNETAYGKRKALVFHAVPTSEEDQSVFGGWRQVHSICVEPDCEGTLNICLPADNIMETVEMWSSETTLNMENQNASGLDQMLFGAGIVDYSGSIQRLTLRNGTDITGSISVTGDVETLYFYDSTSDEPFNGSARVSGTVTQGFVRGKQTIEIPGVETPESRDMILGSFENKTGAIIEEGTLQFDYEPVGASLDMFSLTYRFTNIGGRGLETAVTLNPKPEYQYVVGDQAITYWNIGIAPDQIVWGSDTSVIIQTTAEDDVIQLNGKQEDGVTVGLGRIEIQSGRVEINCPVEVVIVYNFSELAEGVTLKIDSSVDFLSTTNLNSGSILLGENGSIRSGVWSRSFDMIRYFGPETGACTLYNNGSLQVMSWKDFSGTHAILPSDSEVSTALGTGETAMIDMTDGSAQNLTDQDVELLADLLEVEDSSGLREQIVQVFDLDVTTYQVNETGEYIPGVMVSELRSPVSVTINNKAEEGAVLARLHTEDGQTTAGMLTYTVNEDTMAFESDKFSTFVILNEPSRPKKTLNGGGDYLYYTGFPIQSEDMEGVFANRAAAKLSIPAGTDTESAMLEEGVWSMTQTAGNEETFKLEYSSAEAWIVPVESVSIQPGNYAFTVTCLYQEEEYEAEVTIQVVQTETVPTGIEYYTAPFDPEQGCITGNWVKAEGGLLEFPAGEYFAIHMAFSGETFQEIPAWNMMPLFLSELPRAFDQYENGYWDFENGYCSVVKAKIAGQYTPLETILVVSNCNVYGYQTITVNATGVYPETNVLRLPSATNRIEDESFMGVKADTVWIPDGCEYIGENAFADSAVKYVHVTDSVKEVKNGAFPKGTIIFIAEGQPVPSWVDDYDYIIEP